MFYLYYTRNTSEGGELIGGRLTVSSCHCVQQGGLKCNTADMVRTSQKLNQNIFWKKYFKK